MKTYKVEDNGWGKGTTWVTTVSGSIKRGDWYLYLKGGNPRSIELCDSTALENQLVGKSNYLKISAASQPIWPEGATFIMNEVTIIPDLGHQMDS